MLKSVFYIVFFVYLAALVVMYLLQRQMMYFPTPPLPAGAANVMEISSSDGPLKVIAEQTGLPDAVVYFGGNAEDVYTSDQVMAQAFNGFARYYLSYPGYGGSAGSPSEQSIHQAASALFKLVQGKHRSVSIVARSLGTGVATKLASSHKVTSTVLISPYDSITAVAFRHYPIFPMSLLVKDKFDSMSRAAAIEGRVMVMMALWDRVIPPSHSQRLIDEIGTGRVEVVKFKDAGHNDIHLQAEFSYRINDFLKAGIEGL